MMLLVSPFLTFFAAALVGRARGVPAGFNSTTIDLGYAKYRGAVVTPGVVAYYGVPYAEPPVGKLRFRAPKALDTKRVASAAKGAIVDVTTPIPDGFCIQGTIEQGDAGGAGTEDCLKVNIYTPADAKKGSNLPVLFYIHGGDFIYGNPTSFPFDGWVKQSPNVVVVSVYYRLSSFGFLSHPSVSRKDLNAGFQDQVEALRWVQKHISAFGGDPTKVTIDGHSAGGASVELHLVTQSGLQEKLFRAAIAQSVSRRPLPLPEQQAPLFDYYAAAAGCGNKTSFDKTFTCLQSASISALARAQDAAYYNFTGAYNMFHPVMDGALIKDYPTNLVSEGKFAHVPLIVGATSNETFLSNTQFNDSVSAALQHFFPALKASSIPAIEALYPVKDFDSTGQRFTDATGDSTFRCSRTMMGSLWSQSGLKTYTYRYNQPVGGLGATVVWHSAENWLTFNGTSTGVNGTTVYTAQNTAERALGAEVIAYWLSFVRTGGDPNAYKLPRSPQWPNYTAPSRQRVVIQAVDDANGALVNTSAIVAEKEPEIQVQRCEKVRKIADQQQA